jgi:hypothetical protein
MTANKDLRRGKFSSRTEFLLRYTCSTCTKICYDAHTVPGSKFLKISWYLSENSSKSPPRSRKMCMPGLQREILLSDVHVESADSLIMQKKSLWKMTSISPVKNANEMRLTKMGLLCIFYKKTPKLSGL